MKKWILLLPCTLFPYSLLIGLVCFLKGLGNVGEVFGFLPHLFLLSFACSFVFIGDHWNGVNGFGTNIDVLVTMLTFPFLSSFGIV